MKLNQYDQVSQPPFEHLDPKVGTAYKIGQAMVITDGVATPSTDKPTYICMTQTTGEADHLIPAIRVNSDMVLSARLSAAGTALKVGDKVTIATNFIDVTATTTSGVCEITGFDTDEKAAGDTVSIRV